MVRNMRSLALPFVVAPPTGACIRTRLWVDTADERVLWAVGEHLGRLAGQDLAARCRLGGGDAQRAERKRALTGASSSRWAGAITRRSNDQWACGRRNLLEERTGLRRACRVIRARLAVPAGCREGRVRGYASRAERFAKLGRLRHLEARLVQVEARLARGSVSVCRGGRRLAKLRHALGGADVALTEEEWRARWQAARLFVAADGEAGKRWGNETIRVHPDQGWLEVRLPTRWRGCRTRPVGRRPIGCRAGSGLAIGLRSGRRRPPRARLPIPSGWNRSGGAGTWTHHGDSHPARWRPWRRCVSILPWPSTSTPVTWPAG